MEKTDYLGEIVEAELRRLRNRKIEVEQDIREAETRLADMNTGLAHIDGKIAACEGHLARSQDRA